MYLLGVDTGGTKTTAVVFDESRSVLGVGQSGPGNYHVAGRDGARENVEQAIASSLESAGLSRSDQLRAVFAMGALDTDEDRVTIESFLDEISFVDDRVVENDVVVAHHASHAGDAGVTVVSGTGAMAYGTNADGEDARASGWGWVFGDEGSGYDAARRGLQEASKAYDGRTESTALLDAAIEHFDLDTFDDVFPTVYDELEHPKRIASFAEPVAEAAKAGDETALDILEDAGVELATAADAVAEALDLEEPVSVAMMGSFGNAEPVFGLFETALAERVGAVDLVEPLDHPVVGAVVRDAQDRGETVTRAELDRLDAEIDRQLNEQSE